MAQLAVGTHVQHMRFEIGQLGLAVVGVGADDQAMTDTGLVSSGTVDRDDLRTFLAADGVGGEALAIVDVVDLDLFIFTDAGQQGHINGESNLGDWPQGHAILMNLLREN